MTDYSQVPDNYAVYKFSDILPSAEKPIPFNRVMDFMVTGPFVLETDGSFEAEHLYQRDKLLLEDYLASDGGEKNIIPMLGQKVINPYYGPEYYTWEKGFIKWNQLRFDNEEEACDQALFVTEQHNAVFYAAFYVDCDRDEVAVLSHEDSGCAIYVNGELTDFQPFGVVKGLWSMGHQCIVRFKKGRNLVLFKLRPGYIADSIEISISGCVLFPAIAHTDGLFVTSPTLTAAYAGTSEQPKQLFPFFVAAQKDIPSATIHCAGQEISLNNLKANEVRMLRLAIDATENESTNKTEPLTVTVGNESVAVPMHFTVSPYDGFTGNEHVFSDFHFDTTYTLHQRAYAMGAFHITKAVVERLIENPDFKATLSEIDYLHPYYTLFPHHRDAIRSAFADNRAESDCFYNQPNDLTSSGEAFVRNLVYGQLYHRDVLGRISTVYAPGDVFGHFSQMTQVCKKGGCNYLKWGKPMLGVDQLFRHVSPDGSVLLHDKNFGRQDASRFQVSGSGPSGEALNFIEAYPRVGDSDWMKDTVSHVRFSVFSDLAKDVLQSDKENIDRGKGNLIDYTSRDLTQHHSGVLLTRTDFKQANRLCENLLIMAEKFAAIAFLYGASYPELTLDKAWRQLLCAQHHDSVTGTNNEISFVDLMIEYRECAILAESVLNDAARFIASGVRTADAKNAVFIFNPCTWDRKGGCTFSLPESFTGRFAVLTDKNGKEYPVEIQGSKGFFLPDKVPACGYAMYRLREVDSEVNAHVFGKDNTIANTRFTVTVDPQKGGGIVSIYDKKLRREFVDSTKGFANQIHVLKEIHNRMEPQHEFYTTGHRMDSSDYTARITSDKCPLYQKLTVRVKLDVVAVVVQEITLYKGSEQVDFRTYIEDYQSEDDLFTVTFPMNVHSGAVVYDDRFAPHVSTRSKKYLSFQTHQYASFSGCRILPVGNWFGVGPSVRADFSDGSIHIGMTALIRKEHLTDCGNKLLMALSKKAIPVTPYLDTEQHGGMKIIHFNEDVYETDTRFVLCTAGDSNLYAEKIRTNLPGALRRQADKKMNKDGVSLIYIRDNDNAYQKPIDTVLITGRDTDALNIFVDSLCAQLNAGSAVDLSEAILADTVPPCDNFGAVLLNSGNISCSVEDESTLNMMLFHTAAFYGNQGKVTGQKEMVPEQKTHVFTYALCPHKDSYREAQIYKKAYEYNETLFAVTDITPAAGAYLPQSKSFLRSSGSFSITAFKAAGYPMANMTKTNFPCEKRGLNVRGFETDGLNGKAKIQTGFTLLSAENTDLLDEQPKALATRSTGFSFDTAPHSIETFRLHPAPENPFGAVGIEDKQEFISPVYTRSWEHDLGSMPMGYLKFAATLNKKPLPVDETHTVIELNVSNNSIDENVQKTLRIESSEGITVDRTQVDVSLSEGESCCLPLHVTLDKPGRKGQVKLYYDFAGQTFTDVYEFGYFNPEVNLKIDGNEIICCVSNPTDQVLEGALHIATPFETWGLGNNALGNISPAAHSVRLLPFGKAEYRFTADMKNETCFNAYWAAVKLCCNGRIHFAFDALHGPRHNIWAHEFINVIHADNGSIQKILEM